MKKLLSSLLFLVLLHTVTAATPPAVPLRDISVAPDEKGATITLLFKKDVRKLVLEPKKKGVAEIRAQSVSAGKAALNSAVLKKGVRSVKAWIERTDVLVADVTFDHDVAKMEVISRDSGEIRIRVTFGSPGAVTKSKPVSPPAIKSKSTPPSTRKPVDRKHAWSLRTIIIDAGHGGKDPGAIGIGNVREKDITLSVARQLRKEIKGSMPGVNVVMTRSDDTFVELYRRGQIANSKKGKLFISIHCNSMPQKPDPASGFECYILRPGKSDAAAGIAVSENESIRFENDKGKYGAASAESAIVGTMAQSAFSRYSEMLADAICTSMHNRVELPNRGVHQAGFYVLVGASMPSVLVEIGYISNENDVKILRSSTGQKKIARALFEGIRSYEKLYSSSID